MTEEIVAQEKERETERRRACVAGLRELADFIERHEDLPVPYGCNLNVFASDKAELARLARVGGVKWQKASTPDYFYLRAVFEGDYSYEVNIDRSAVCRKVVTGTRLVPAQPEQTVEEFHWVCDEPLLSEGR